MKKILTLIILTTFIATNLLPLTALAASHKEGICGENVTWKLDTDGVLTICGEGVMTDYSDSRNVAPWFSYRTSVTSIVIENGITEIGAYAFYNCSNATSVTIPDTIVSVDEGAFSVCSALTAVNISDLSAWSNIDFESQPLTYAHYLYLNGEMITNLDNLSNVTKIKDHAFNSCYGFTELTIPDGITHIGKYAFYNNLYLTTLTLPDSLQHVDENAFDSCDNLVDLQINSLSAWLSVKCEYDASPMKYADNIYIDGELLSGEIVIPGDVKRIEDYAFYQYKHITKLTIPVNVNYIGDYAFNNCKQLEDISIADGVEYIGKSVFGGTSYLKNDANWVGNGSYIGYSLYIDNYYISSKFYGYIFGGDSTLPLELKDGTRCIAKDAFPSGTLVTNLVIPSTVVSIPEGIFCTFKYLKEINVNSLNAHYSSENGILFNKDKTAIVAFPNYKDLDTYIVPKTVKHIAPYAFFNSSINGIRMKDNVKSIGSYAFANCSGLDTVTIDNPLIQIESYAFYNCDYIEDIYFMGGETAKNAIASQFYSGTWHNMKYTPQENSVYNLWDENIITFEISFPFEIANYESFAPQIKDYHTGKTIKSFESVDYWQDADDLTKLIFVCTTPLPCGRKMYVDIAPGSLTLKDFGVYYGITDKDIWSFTTSFGLTRDEERVSFLNRESDFFEDYASEKSSYPIASADLKSRLETLIGKSDLKTQQKKKKSFGGACFGISTVTALYKAGLLDITEFDSDATNLYTMAKPKDSTGANGVRDLINYYYMLQRVDEYKITGLNTLSANLFSNYSSTRSKFKNTVKSIVDTALDMDNSKTPLILNYGKMVGNQTFQHSVVLCSGRKNADNTYTLLVKDPNYNELKEITVSYDYYTVTDHSGGRLIVLKVIDPNDISSDLLIGEVETTSVDDYDILKVTAYGNFEITNGQYKKIVMNDGCYYEDSISILNESFSASADGEYAEYVFYVESSDSYTFTSSDSRSGFTVISGNDYVSVDSENASAITINNGENVSVNGTDMSYQLFTTTADAENMLMVTGDSASSVSVALSVDGGAEITSDSEVRIESLYDDRILNPDSDGTTTLTKDADGKLTAETAFGWTADNIVISEDTFSCDITFEEGFTQDKAYATVAFYENVKLVQLSLKEIDVKSGEVAMDIQNLPYDSYKIFIWTDMNEMTPLEK